jgi:integrase
MGSIREWHGGYQARYRDAAGRSRTKSFSTRLEARRFITRTEADVQRGDYVDPRLGKITFAEWSSEWSSTTVHLRPGTRALYASDLRTHLLPRFGAIQLARITPVEVRSWLSALAAGPLASSTVNRQYRLLRRILAVAVESDVLVKSPCAGVKPPVAREVEMRFLSPADIDTLADAINPRYRALVLLAAYSGLRWGELVGLRRKHLDLLRRSVVVVEQMTEVEGRLEAGPPKTAASRRRVALPRFLVPVLEEQLAERSQPGPDGLVFTTSTGGPLRRSSFRTNHWLPATRDAGLAGLRVHDLRHTAVALAIGAGAHARAIQERMGHSSPMLTLGRYGHLLEGLDDRVADGLDVAYREQAEAAPRAAVAQLRA